MEIGKRPAQEPLGARRIEDFPIGKDLGNRQGKAQRGGQAGGLGPRLEQFPSDLFHDGNKFSTFARKNIRAKVMPWTPELQR
jgi:hypothetical protein